MCIKILKGAMFSGPSILLNNNPQILDWIVYDPTIKGIFQPDLAEQIQSRIFFFVKSDYYNLRYIKVQRILTLVFNYKNVWTVS